ncbi:MAG: tRNA lysidine(34) synthetase TilS [Bacteroidetes bacterium]|nr:MAG: tRNA lysidine(34) synthetase TilS [Bacteroidota bacterium]
MKNLSFQFTARFKNELEKCEVEEGELVIAACSGGVDSMCLVNALLKGGAKFEVAHVNFKLRGEDSEADSKLVQEWCDANGVVCHVRHLPADEEAKRKGDGIQDAARRLRYAWFEELRVERMATCIAVAHHLKDQTETLLIQLIRGVDPSSLGGMSLRNGYIVRPFLSWSQEEIEEWVSLDGVPFREDLSNQSPKYLRNRIRNEVLPLLESIRPGSTNHLAEWTTRLRSQALAVESSMSDASRDIIKYSDSGFELDSDVICRIELISLGNSDWGDQVFDRLLAERKWPLGAREQALLLKRATIGAEVVYKDDSLIREREHIILRKIETVVEDSDKDSSCKIEVEHGNFHDLYWSCEVENLDSTPPLDASILWLDFYTVEHPLLWRLWENGDKIEPNGMEGTVNISDLLTQWKVPHLARSQARVLQDARGNILWVFATGNGGKGEVWSRISRKTTLTKGAKRLIFQVKA